MSTSAEVITAIKFDESFKNMLRDYYTYGFKRLSDYGAQRQTRYKDWQRLNSILSGNYLEWSDQPQSVLYTCADSQTMDQNPFHQVYRFAQIKHSDYFLHTMAALSPLFRLRKHIEEAGITEKVRYDLEDSLEENGSLLTSQLNYFYIRDTASTKTSTNPPP
ncbi:MAG: hypothetical protein LUF35_07250 [Lachnospiraceae bacterium]|nr:hypothetical protein [Lachnospiraceae bacterium]